MDQSLISLHEQACEVELHFQGLRDLHTRAREGRFKRSVHEIERLAQRRDVAEVATRTLHALARKQDGKGK